MGKYKTIAYVDEDGITQEIVIPIEDMSYITKREVSKVTRKVEIQFYPMRLLSGIDMDSLFAMMIVTVALISYMILS